jgi:hypothetical protein
MRSGSNDRAKEPAKGLKREQRLAMRGRTALKQKGAKGHKHRRIWTERAREKGFHEVGEKGWRGTGGGKGRGGAV